MPSSVNLQALGLNVSQNQLQAPDGSLIKASNVVIKRSGIIESRRGFKLYGDTFGTSGNRASQLIEYKDTILRHFTNTLQFDNGEGTFNSFSGTYSPVQTGLRIKSIEANGNLYFTTSEGIKKLSARVASDFSTSSGFITKAGGIKALDVTTSLNTNSTATPWFLDDSVIAYRVVWGIKDANNNLILGTPSERSVLYYPMSEAIIRDYMRILGALDNINQSGCLIDDGNYVDTLKLPLTSTPDDIQTNLISLATKIDNDILYADVGGPAPLDMTGANYSLTSNVLTINFSAGDARDYFSIGSNIFIANLDTDLNGARVISEVDTTAGAFIRISITHTNIGATPIPGSATIVSNEFRSITQPSVPSVPATHAELVELEDYITSILDELQAQVNGVIPTSLKATYIDVLSITSAATVNVQITIPSDVTLSHFYQIYRTSLLTAVGTDVLEELVPNDEMRLVYEANPTQDDLDIGSVTVEDITPDSFAGSNLYTNPNSGEGILQANDVPPFAKDINRFKEVTFYANTKTKHRQNLQLLGVTAMIDSFNNSIIPTLTIANSDIANTYSFIIGKTEITEITCTNKASIPVSGYFLISTASNEKMYYVWFDTTGTDSDPSVANRTGIKVDISAASIVTATDVASRLRDVLSIYVDDFSVDSLADVVTVENSSVGFCDDAENGTTSFAFSITQDGRGERASKQETTITTVADVAGSLAGTYFTISTAFNQDNYYFWYRVSGSGSDPSIAGKTGIVVDISTNDTANTVASQTAIKLAALTNKFTVDVNTNVISIVNYRYGPCSNATAGTSGFTVEINELGALDVLLSDSASPAQAVDQTMRSLIRIININKTDVVYAFNISSTEDLPGKVTLEAKTLEDNEYFIMTNASATGNSFSPTISPTFTISSISAATEAVVTTAANHNLTTDDFVVLSGTDSTPSIDGVYQVTVLSPTTFSIPKTTSVVGTIGGGANIFDAEVSENEEKPNRIYYSKYQQPEAVPLLNYFDVGSKDEEIVRIIPLRDSLFVFKKDGVYRVSGEVAPFTTSLFDSTMTLFAPDSLAPANNSLYGWFEEGIGVVTESGIINISRPIDILTLKVQTYTNFNTATFGVGYHSDNSYTVYTVNKDSDEVASIAFRYSNLTNSWTTFDRGATCGLVASFNDKMYLGAAETNSLEIERKAFTRKDYCDYQFSKFINPLSYQNSQIAFPSVTEFEVGDALVQTQYLTSYKYNVLLSKFDMDTGLSDNDYRSSLEITGLINISDKLSDMIEKVRDDSGRHTFPGYTPDADYTALLPIPSDFEGVRDSFNDFIDLLNSDSGIGFSDYSQITAATDFETLITAVSPSTKKVTVKDHQQFIEGPVILYKSIPTSVTYAAQTMGDPLSLKQIYDSTLMLEARSFTNFTLSYASDLLPSFETISFTGDSNGAFGVSNNFGDNFFGGISNSAPLRTSIPRNKQRCRYLVVNFEHSTAFEHYSVLGLTLTGNITSNKAFR